VAWGLLTLPSQFEWKLYKGEDWAMDVADHADVRFIQNQFAQSDLKQLECRVTGSKRLGWTLKQIEARASWDKFPDDLNHAYLRVDHLTCGLPMRCLRGLRRWPSEEAFAQSGKLAITSQRDSLPMVPIWPGFAINTIFYAGVLWMMFAIPGTIRRRRRLKRGLCPNCAYPIGTWGGEVCTECGARHHSNSEEQPR
jgi:hypothetical protein